MRVLHVGDIHLDYEPKINKKVCDSLDQIVKYVEENETDIIVIPGDLNNKRQKEPYYDSINNEGLGIKKIKEYLTKLSSLVRILIISSGNAAHDEKGSIAIWHQYKPNIYAYEHPVLLALYDEEKEIKVIDLLRTEPDLLEEMAEAKTKPIATISMIPYPTKSLLAREVSIDQTNQEFSILFDGLMDVIGLINNKFTCPKILGFHGNVLGCRLSNGQNLLGQDIIIAPVSLRKSNCHYYALNHIHMFQEIEDNIWYAGSVASLNWGELEKKYFVEIITDKEKVVSKRKIELIAARPMVEVKAKFTEGKLIYDRNIPANAEVRFKFDVAENETNLISDELLEEVKTVCGNDVIIDKNIVPVQRESRSEAIMQATTLADEFIEYTKVIGEVVTEIKIIDGQEKEVLKSSLAKKLELIEQDEMEF
jgi:hypothetical protein